MFQKHESILHSTISIEVSRQFLYRSDKRASIPMKIVKCHVSEDYESAFRTMEFIDEPKFPYEFLLKGIVHLLMGQSQLSPEYMISAREYFQSAGMDRNIQRSSSSLSILLHLLSSDTPNGRLAMSAYFFLAGEFSDAAHFLDSLRVNQPTSLLSSLFIPGIVWNGG